MGNPFQPQEPLTAEYLHDLHSSCHRFIFFDESGPGVLMRHDVDNNLYRSLKLAEIQHAHGWRATYFILNTAPYHKPGPDYWHHLRTFIEMGHRVEWHNNAVTESLLSHRRKTPYQCAKEALDQFRQNGIYVTGSASHGDPHCHRFGYINYQMFAECQGTPGPAPVQENPGPLKDGIRMHLPFFEPVPMQELGLKWEAYHVPHDAYFSEPGGRWKVKPDFDTLRNPDVRTQVLIHPQWWDLHA